MIDDATYLCIDCKSEFAPNELRGSGGEFLETLDNGTKLIWCAECAD